MKGRFLLLTLCFFPLLSCNLNVEKKQGGDVVLPAVSGSNVSDDVRFADGFRIETHQDYTLLTVFDPRLSEKTLVRYVLVPKSVSLPQNLPVGTLIRTPVERVICSGAVQCSFLSAIGEEGSIVGVYEPHHINIASIKRAIGAGLIADAGRSSRPDFEKIMVLSPELIFGVPLEDVGGRHTSAVGVPDIFCLDHLESTPLGRAEWLRFYAMFFEKRAVADSLFSRTVDRYEGLRSLACHSDARPTVFSETIYSGIWWLPGGGSYMSCFFRDAGAEYVFSDDFHTGSIGKTFEDVFSMAWSADVWLIKYGSSREMTLETLASDNPRYKLFNAWKNGSIYAANLSVVPYYEELPVYPDYILQDLIIIFHPELLPDQEVRYFRRLK
jgi:iron complex transport system substrate-binding protein